MTGRSTTFDNYSAVVLVVVFLATNARRLLQGDSTRNVQLGWRQMIWLTVVGIWTGALVIDGGVFLLMVLTLSVGYELTRANAARAVLSLPLTLMSAAVFIAGGQTDWSLATCLAVGTSLGS
ncbi:MAG: TSUP family transporter [Candidatus Binataceae bacterium]